jgi:hypothetical protein
MYKLLIGIYRFDFLLSTTEICVPRKSQLHSLRGVMPPQKMKLHYLKYAQPSLK